MPYIDYVRPTEATGETLAMYQRQQSRFGYVPNYAKPFSHRPELMKLWADLLAGIRRNMEARRFELVTLGAALALRSSYCSLAHGRVLSDYFSAEEVRAIATEPEPAPLTAAERAVLRYARQVALDAAAVTAEDVAALKAEGLSDAEIFDVAAAAAGRAFFAKIGDALGAAPDAVFLELAPELREVLTVGRAIDEAEPEVLGEAKTTATAPGVA